ncbi:hypothetical protein ElyMa_005621500 [Elysia marginata]|uniref:Uncharacterized protein n=1 Tax=Elysia marginata TaxID=1093978 RepID=A0AAV4F7A9_9GAST|nr:hypothetical protein ElyMa_005621500 [Elysia marginata]
MSTALMGRVEGCRKRRRPAMSLMGNITTITGLSLGEVVYLSRDREGWRTVVAFIGGATIEHGVADDCHKVTTTTTAFTITQNIITYNDIIIIINNKNNYNSNCKKN